MSFIVKADYETVFPVQLIRRILEPRGAAALVTRKNLERVLGKMFPNFHRLENDNRTPSTREFLEEVDDNAPDTPGFELEDMLFSFPATPNDVLFRVLLGCVGHMCEWMDMASDGELQLPPVETREYIFRENVVSSADILCGDVSCLYGLAAMKDTTHEELVALENMLRHTIVDYMWVWTKYEEIRNGRGEEYFENVERFMGMFTPLMMYVADLFDIDYNFDHRTYFLKRPWFACADCYMSDEQSCENCTTD